MTRQTITERLAGGGGGRRRAAAAVAAIVVVVVVIAVIVSAGAPASSKGQGTPGASTGAATVQRRDLVETDTESGTLGYANAQTVFNRLSGTITYLPNVGQVVDPGRTLYQVDGYPVILFNGSYPAYRDLTSGDGDGADITELNADLKAMGFDPDGAITVDDAWQAATTDAVERFQGSIGQTETGTISLGQIVFLPGPQLINAIDTTVGSTGGSAGAGSGSGTGSSSGTGSGSGASDSSDPTSSATNASYQPTGQPHAEFVDLTTLGTVTPKAAPPDATPACPSNPTTTTTTTTTPATTTTGCPSATTPTGPTTTPAPTTPTSPMSGTSGSSGSTLEAIIQLLRTQNKLLQAQLKAALKSGSSKTPTSGAAKSGATKTGGGGGGGSTSGGGASSSGGSSGTGSGSGSGSTTGSGAGSSATPILSTTSTNLVVTVDLDATKQSEAKLHEGVTVQLPDGSTVNGRITGVSPVATTTSSGSSSSSPSSSAPSATIPVTVSLDKRANTRGLDQAAVSVNFAQQVANNVLSVPVTALLATQGGGYAVQEATPPHKLIPVTPGLFAAGFVQISGPQVQDGMQVTDSQG